MHSRQAILSLLVLCAVAACHRPPATAPEAVVVRPAPRPAPKATIRAIVTGSGMAQEVSAEFATEQDAFVVVGHLGNDGRVRILFPDNARQSGFIRGQQQYQIGSFAAEVDAHPSLWSLTRPPTRSAGARMDSYDGGGSAYLFVISSGEPLTFDDIADFDGSFDSYLLPPSWYENPRLEVEQFARILANGNPFRVQFAYGFNTTRYASLSDRLYQCARLQQSGLNGLNAYERPWVWSWLGNDINFWEVSDMYAGMIQCNQSHWFPGVYAFNVPEVAPTPTTTKQYAGLRVVHLPLVSSRSVARGSDEGTGSESSTGTTNTSYVTHRVPGTGTSTDPGTTTTSLRPIAPTVTSAPTTTVTTLRPMAPTVTSAPATPVTTYHPTTITTPSTPTVVSHPVTTTTTTTTPSTPTTSTHDAPHQPPARPQKP